MAVGPHVFGPGRRGLWIADSSNLKDKLIHILPRLRAAIPNLTDLFLPPSATAAHRKQVIAAGFFSHAYEPPPHGRTATQYAAQALAGWEGGALELNIEGVPDPLMREFVLDVHGLVRAAKPNLPLRFNVLAYKGQFVPTEVFGHPQTYGIIQAYGGNMDEVFAAEEIIDEAVKWGHPRAKFSVMHAVYCAQAPGKPRQIVMPQLRDRGSYYIDDLLQEAGLV